MLHSDILYMVMYTGTLSRNQTHHTAQHNWAVEFRTFACPDLCVFDVYMWLYMCDKHSRKQIETQCAVFTQSRAHDRACCTQQPSNHRDTNINSTFSFLPQVPRKAHREKITSNQSGVLHLHRDLEINTWYHRCSLSQSLESEAPRQSPEAAAPAPSWPQQGKITFQDVEMRYRDDLPLVLKNLSFTILPDETIGIVGRTGSGMSDPLCSPASSNFTFLKKIPFSTYALNAHTFVHVVYFLYRKVLSGCSSVQTCRADWRLYYHWRNQYCPDWSGWPAEQASHYSTRACALHRHCQVIQW